MLASTEVTHVGITFTSSYLAQRGKLRFNFILNILLYTSSLGNLVDSISHLNSNSEIFVWIIFMISKKCLNVIFIIHELVHICF